VEPAVVPFTAKTKKKVTLLVLFEVMMLWLCYEIMELVFR
jgi:hypothetical protein